MTVYGYARVSTEDQDPQLQIDALRQAGCEVIFSESASGGRWERPELQRLLDGLVADDVVVVWKLDRLSRSLKDLLRFIERVEEVGAGFRSTSESIDTRSAGGRMMMQMLGAFAEFERQMIRERTRAGMAAAKKRGLQVGRPPAMTDAQEAHALELLDAGKTQAEVARLLGVSASTIYRLARRRRQTA